MRRETASHKRRRGKAATSVAAEPAWETPPEFVKAWRDEVHVWRACLDVQSSHVQRLALMLSADERERAERFRFQRHRDHFVAARVFLRILIGQYLQKEPDQIQFSYNPYGKPYLAQEGNHAPSFNLSHSEGLALYAVTRDREIGVDVEHISKQIEVDSIAERFFSSREVAAFRSLPQRLRRQAFFTCWTRKEAYIKAKGEGLSTPLDKFSVSLSPGEPAMLVDVQVDPKEVSRWSLSELNPDPRYVAALAVEGHDWMLRCWELTADHRSPAFVAGRARS